MKITFRDCLQLSVLSRGVVVAGEKNLDNRVKNISVLDASCPEEAVLYNGKPEELILTAFSGMKKNTEMQVETIKELAKTGVAGIVILQRENAADYHNYQEVIRVSEDAGLPLVILAAGLSAGYSEIIAQVMEKVLYSSNFKNSLINNTIFHLLNFERYSSFRQALREAAVSNEFQVVLLSEEFNPIFNVETRHKIAIDAAIRRGREFALNFSHVYSLIEIEGVLTYWGKIENNGEKYYLLIVDNEDNYSAGEITKLAEIIELAMGMWKFTPERDAKAEFVKALIRGNRSLAYSLREEVGIKPQDLISVFYARGLDTIKSEDIIASYEERKLLKVIRLNEEGELYGVVFKGEEIDKGEEIGEKAVCIKMFDEMKEDKSVRIFHVTGVDAIEGAGDGFHIINETWSSVGYIFPYKRVFTKYELALVSNCMNIKMQGGYLKKNYSDLLGPFRKEGDNKAKQLLDTLETFVLDAGMNSGKTAEFMGIHTNTVQYRLKKINDVLGAEITGNRVIPGLTIALALQRIEAATN